MDTNIFTELASKFINIFLSQENANVQWLRLHVPNTGGLLLIPGQGTRSHMPQLKIPHAAMKIPHAATKIRCSQINK